MYRRGRLARNHALVQTAGRADPGPAPPRSFGCPGSTRGIDEYGFRYLLRAAKTRRLYVKLSGVYRNGTRGRGEHIALGAVPLLKDAFGVDRLLWGSDWPHTLFEKEVTYAGQRRLLDKWLPEAADRRAVLAETPWKLYRFG